ncbi:hypothetical protein B9G55_19835 [Saccharibacillus sp. O16]|nr:hypothetical protein B9G55_19835 [Saccharibacillus sp. O16]
MKAKGRCEIMQSTWSKIGDGGTAELYLNEDGKVVKLFREWFSEGSVRSEYRKSMWAYEDGVPTAKPLGMQQYQGRQAILMEKVEGESLLERLHRHPDTAAEAARTFADYQVRLNARPAETLQDHQRERVVQRVIRAKQLEDRERKEVLAELEKLPDDNRLCHGDYHPGNIMEAPDGWRVIDWIDATCGHPLYDPARTLLLIGFGIEQGGARSTLEQAAHVFRETYLEAYIQLSGCSAADIQQWMLPAAAARLIEPIPAAEKDKLLEWIRKRLNELNH